MSIFFVLFCKTVVQCSSLTQPEYGDVTPSQCLNNPPYGTLCQYTCQKGYRVNGSQIRSCSSSGKWSYNAFVVCKGTEQYFFLFVIAIGSSGVQSGSNRTSNFITGQS